MLKLPIYTKNHFSFGEEQLEEFRVGDLVTKPDAHYDQVDVILRIDEGVAHGVNVYRLDNGELRSGAQGTMYGPFVRLGTISLAEVARSQARHNVSPDDPRFSDEMAKIHQGYIEAQATCSAVYPSPSTSFV